MLNAREMIRRKRDGGELDGDEIRAFLTGVLDGSIPHYQAAAMLMAVYFRGMTGPELARFTAAMIDSGDRLHVEGGLPKVDKHSTGGVGDKVSIPLAPLVAVCGAVVPMMSGRGLGHTGGTLDKLESIPGFRTSLSPEEFALLSVRNGAAMGGQSERIVPADKVLYALRDTTATVSSIPLISSSIMSKKLAEGLDALVLDVKVGNGAFMENLEDARLLAETMVRIGKANGVKTRAFLTDMDQPLGREVGNANEITESIEVLRGGGPPDLRELVLALGAAMLDLAGLKNRRGRLERALESGEALARFAEMAAAQGGDPSVIENPERLPAAVHSRELRADRDGYTAAIDAREIGLAAMHLGAGRRTADDSIDHGVGITLSAKVGDPVRRGDVLAALHFNDPKTAEGAAALAEGAYRLADRPPSPRPLILEEIG